LLRVIDENKVSELAEYHLSAPQFLSVKSHDGVPLNAVMIKPPDFDASKKYPVLVFNLWRSACAGGLERLGRKHGVVAPV